MIILLSILVYADVKPEKIQGAVIDKIKNITTQNSTEKTNTPNQNQTQQSNSTQNENSTNVNNSSENDPKSN